MISALVLDLDGPLLDGMLRHYRCYCDILEGHGYSPISLERYWDMKRNKVDRRTLLECSDALPFYDKFLASWIERIEARSYLKFDRLQKRVINVLSKWKERKIRLLLATMRNNPSNLAWQLDRLNIYEFFDDFVVVGGGRDSANKASAVRPKLAGLNTDQVIWVGDTEVDVDAARELGIRVCALTCGLRSRDYLLTLSPDYIEADIASFAEETNKKHA